jgi:hypothetical protein
VCPYQSQAELLNLLEKLLELFVIGDPCLHLREEFLGNIDGLGLVAGTAVGHVLGGVQRAAVMTATGATAAAVRIAAQGGSQNRRAEPQPLEPVIEHAANQGGMVGNTHDGSGNRERNRSKFTLSGKKAEWPGSNKRCG